MRLRSTLHSRHYSVSPCSLTHAATAQTDLRNVTVDERSLQFLLHDTADHIVLFEIISCGFSDIALSCQMSDSSGHSSKPPLWYLSHLLFTDVH